MTFGTKNYGAVASAYGPLTRLMPKSKDTGVIGQADVDKRNREKQKGIQNSLLEYTKRMDKIKQARVAISKSREQGRLSARPKHQARRVVLPGITDLESDALAMTRKYISQAQWSSANSIARNLIETNKEASKRAGTIKSNIFSHEIQKLSDDTSPSNFTRYWKVVGGDGEVKHIPVFKTAETIVYSAVTRPATINKPKEGLDKNQDDSTSEIIKVDADGTTRTHVKTQSYRKYHPGILPRPGMKGPYKSKVTLHVSLPQVESDLQDDEDDQDNDTESCSIDLPQSSEDSRVDSPRHTKMNETILSNETQANKDKFEAAIQNGDPNEDVDADIGNKELKDNPEESSKVKGDATQNMKISSDAKIEKETKDPISGELSKSNRLQHDVKNVLGALRSATQHIHKEGSHYPCADCPACAEEENAKQTQKSILKRDSKPLPDIPVSTDPSQTVRKPRRSSLQQIHIPGGIVKLGKVTYHRSYKIKPLPPTGNRTVESGKAQVTLHDSFEEAVNGTDVIKDAERTLSFEKNRHDNLQRRKKFSDENGKRALWQSLCRHGRFINECYTCRAVEEIRQRLQNSHDKSEQQYQWNLLTRHERQITRAQGIGHGPVKTIKQPGLPNGTRYRLSALSNATDLSDIPLDTSKPLGLPGGRVATDKDGGRQNPQGFGPSEPESKPLEEEVENGKHKKVRFAEARIYDPMRGAYREMANEDRSSMVAKT